MRDVPESWGFDDIVCSNILLVIMDRMGGLQNSREAMQDAAEATSILFFILYGREPKPKVLMEIDEGNKNIGRLQTFDDRLRNFEKGLFELSLNQASRLAS